MDAAWSPIAIVGLGGVFPDAADPLALWERVLASHSAAAEVGGDRWVLAPDDAHAGERGVPDRVASLRACLVKAEPPLPPDLALSADALAGLDPLYRLGLAAAGQAIAALPMADRTRTGLVLGTLVLPDAGAAADAAAVLDGDGDATPAAYRGPGLPGGLIARALGLGLGGFGLDAACASSLYAIKLACAELAAGRADLMLAGGLSRPDSLYTQMGFSQLRALSARGACTPFDAAGDGLVVGEGAGVLALKRLADAERDGDTIFAVIRGIGTSNDIDGSLLAPSSEGQQRAMRAAYALAGWDARQVGHFECHATGTPLGDGVEVASVKAVRGGPAPAVLGSVKSNVGHLLTAAGSAGMIKTVMALREGVLPPTAGFGAASPDMGLAAAGLRVLSKPEPWERPAAHPRRAAVSAFGFGGINAHVLVEAYEGPDGVPAPEAPEAPAVAIVGMGARFGGLATLREFQEAVLGGRVVPAHKRRAARGDGQAGWFLADDVEVPAKAFRIPPKELADMLPQQALMLLAADEALRDAGGELADRSVRRPRAGTYVGIGLDPRTTDYHRRWQRLARGEQPATPPLTADRTVGALGGMVASRLAREFRFGGPSHTLQAEEASAFRAFEAGVRALQRGELDVALVGAVDLAGDPRAISARLAEGAPPPTGEGAGAMVLKRLVDAERDGDRIYAVVAGLGAAGGAGRQAAVTAPDAAAVLAAAGRAWAEAGVAPAAAGLWELDGGGHAAEAEALTGLFGGEQAAEAEALTGLFGARNEAEPSVALGRVAGVVGRTGAAAGIASLMRAAFALYQEILPAGDASERGLPTAPAFHVPRAGQYWFHDAARGPRRAGVDVLGLDGTAGHVVLAAALAQPVAAAERVARERLRPLGAAGWGLFTLAADTNEALADGLNALEAEVTDRPIEALARHWWQRHGQATGKLGLAIVARDAQDLRVRIGDARRTLAGDAGPASDPALPTASVFYAPRPLGPDAPLAFVFPGSGNHFPGMGLDLWAAFPAIPRAQGLETGLLASQVRPAAIAPWRAKWPAGWEAEAEAALASDHRTTLLAQVAHGALMYDLVMGFGVKPAAVVGYSLGETAGFVSTRTWTDRDELARRMATTTLFTEELGGRYAAAARAWGLPDGEAAQWTLGVVDRSPAVVKGAIADLPRAYLLIVNAPGECVLGGDPLAVATAVERLGCTWVELAGVTSVHCAVAAEVEEPYRALHDLPTSPPEGVKFYSGCWGKSYGVTRETAAGSIVAQALEGVFFPTVVRAAWVDGARAFVELGPRHSCSRMVKAILGDRPHMARSACMKGQDGEATLLRLLAHLHAERLPVDLTGLYGGESLAVGLTKAGPAPGAVVRIPLVAPAPRADEPPNAGVLAPKVVVAAAFAPPARAAIPPARTPVTSAAFAATPAVAARSVASLPASAGFNPLPQTAPAPRPQAMPMTSPSTSSFAWAAQAADALASQQGAVAEAHAAFLALAQQQGQALVAIAGLHAAVGIAPPARMGHPVAPPIAPPPIAPPTAPPFAPPRTELFMDRSACLAYARGAVGPVLGDYFAPADAFPTRVRLPDEPLMLVDRILSVTGERGSLTHGTVVTEHDVLPDSWYLDGGRIPTCIAVEAGQADLFLSGWLGIDFKTRGLACYRLLDAIVTFHGPLPGPGQVITYDIAIDRFMEQGGVTLFFFRFDATVDGQPLLTMSEGCAGFFTPEQLADGRGIVFTAIESRPRAGEKPANWRDLAPMHPGPIDVAALRAGDLAGAFGPAFANLPIQRPATIPGGRMTLVDIVTAFEPSGGRCGIGLIRAEHGVTPDAWYLTCHFVDDMVMPGTLMYECCMHTLRIFLMRMGWVGEAGTVVYEPIAGVASRLKCRGQVLRDTQTVTYEITLKALRYAADGTPEAIADALMYADGKPIVLISDMSVRASGLNRAQLEALWQAPVAKALYGPETITAFATGKPSEAFGDRYLPFDRDRKIARLPGPPYKFLDRVTHVTGEPWVCQAGATCVADYDVPPTEWYFTDEGQPTMPFAVLLEVGLQPCGWLAAYVGSALTADVDLSFRNLGGKAVQHRLVGPDAGTLSTAVTLSKVSISGGMVVQEYTFKVTCRGELVYDGWTMFGFFTKPALAQQVGIRGEAAWDAPPLPLVVFPDTPAPMPVGRMRMVDGLDAWDPTGGKHGKGFLRGRKRVDPSDWFFAAHFFEDPVCPGSLGLESLLQLLRVEAARRWGAPAGAMQSMKLGHAHAWLYRGQILPTNHEAVVEAHIKLVDDATGTIVADGLLLVDGRPIYGMTDFAIAWPPGGRP